jgi:hypothetical protein
MPETDPRSNAELSRDIRALRAELARLNSHRFIRIHNSFVQLLLFQFLRGLALGLGTVIGASALVSVVVLVLSQVEFVPILGDLATRVISEIEIGRQN